jgi:predicted SprT family Zn-dependent metalloprotease
MTLREAQQLALSLMKQHGVIQDGWQFQWSNGKRQLGCAQIRKRRDTRTGKIEEVKTIKLSRHLVALNDEDEVRDTILHEIAHAIAGVENGHNAKWKAVCRKIGAKPVRLAGEEVAVVPHCFELICGCCGHVVAKRHRRMNAERLKHCYCRDCGLDSKGRLRQKAV